MQTYADPALNLTKCPHKTSLLNVVFVNFLTPLYQLDKVVNVHYLSYHTSYRLILLNEHQFGYV